MGWVLAGLLWAATVAATAQDYTFTTLAGRPEAGPGAVNGASSLALFNHPQGVAVDGAGDVYVADTGNNTIRKITPAGVVTTLAGLAGFSGSTDGAGAAARFSHPYGVAVDAAGNVYVADCYNYTIRKVTSDGVVTTLAGSAGSSGSNDGTGSTARFTYPSGVAVDGSGNVYVADNYNNTIRKVSTGGVVTTLAGAAGCSGNADGTGSTARFWAPWGVAADRAGNVYVADADNDTIRKVTAGGAVTTLAGLAGVGGTSDGAGSAARFSDPAGVAVDHWGNVYVADFNNHTIRTITPGGMVSTLAGVGGFYGMGYADGTGAGAGFHNPCGVAVDTAGNVYVADTGNNTIRKIAPGGLVTTLTGKEGNPGSADGDALSARFSGPSGVAVDAARNVYVADTGNQTIRKVMPEGIVATLAGVPGSSGTNDGPCAAARFYNPSGVAVDGGGNVYVADQGNHTIRKVTPDGTVTTLAGLAGSSGTNDGPGCAARFDHPYGVAVDASGNLYVADMDNGAIRMVTTNGVVTTLAGLAGTQGTLDGTGSVARFSSPHAVAVDHAGTVFVADTLNFTIRKVTPDGVVTTIAGIPESSGSADGAAAAAQFCSPTGLALDAAGNVFVADHNNHTIRRLSADGIVDTVGGVAGGLGSADGTGSAAQFDHPSGLAADNAGNLYVADTDSNTIRLSSPACPDLPTISPLFVSAGQLCQFDTSPQTAVTWQWRFLRAPSASSAALSDPGARDPTFTPGVQDLYAFRFQATNSAGAISIRTFAFSPLPVVEAALRNGIEGGGAVVFPCGGTVTVTNTLVITRDTLLDCSGNAVTISGGGAVPVLRVESNVVFSAIGLTVANGQGNAGAGIYNAGGRVNLTNCAFPEQCRLPPHRLEGWLWRGDLQRGICERQPLHFRRQLRPGRTARELQSGAGGQRGGRRRDLERGCAIGGS